MRISVVVVVGVWHGGTSGSQKSCTFLPWQGQPRFII